MNRHSSKPSKFFLHFDSIILSTVAILSLLIIAIIIVGDRSIFKINDFSGIDQQIGADTQAISFTFNRHVLPSNLDNNIKLEPYLPGKTYLAGNKLFYTFTKIPRYDTNYKIQLAGIKATDTQKIIEPFTSQIKTRDRLLAYIGIKAKERGRLILYNLTKNQKNILTPPDLLIVNFETYPQSDKILFSALDNNGQAQEFGRQQLYTVTTGINWQANQKTQPAGRIQLILDSKNYQNQKFDLSNDGKIIVVQRTNNKNPGDSSLWIIPDGDKPRLIGISGNQFLISPDSKTTAVAQGKGIFMLALAPEASSSQQFIPGYGKLIAFSRDGSQKLVVRYNRDYSQSLSLITEANNTQDLFRSNSPIADCQFNPNNEDLIYCLKTEVKQTEGSEQTYEQPVLYSINLTTLESKIKAIVPNYQDVKMSVSPDGKVILFDQTSTTPPRTNNELLTDSGGAIADGSVWSLSLEDSNKTPPQPIANGFHPQWIK
jgi:dipeptidyl aminopeptidase/acylaminoacyl peptidase